jgi:hypothetical protein
LCLVACISKGEREAAGQGVASRVTSARARIFEPVHEHRRRSAVGCVEVKLRFFRGAVECD